MYSGIFLSKIPVSQTVMSCILKDRLIRYTKYQILRIYSFTDRIISNILPYVFNSIKD